MNGTEYALAYMIEECAEVSEQANRIAIRASKALRFGLDEAQAGQLLTNAQRLWAELADLMALGELALDLGLITRDDIDRKKEKVEKFQELSRKLGCLDA